MNRQDFFLTGEDVGAEPYRYRACGLDGIYLLNGYRIEEYDGEPHVAISDIEGLHKAIGRHLVLHRKALAPREIRFLRNTMDMTQLELAERLSCTSQSVARWEKGECEMHGAAEKLLRLIYLVSLVTDEELRRLLETGLDELDRLDESGPVQAQFQLNDHWAEKIAA